ncbi:hypothetical protein IE81DRAFT_369670 [Ceraceosorus guamensis]|uniref:Uncharacterized protein n=1 Tax=Ceraceosorus guamensis TaxID=1522189 RepID=A0A316VMY7_9BASI|nr:hypothetical protein IE81DRAFT_369670 [Ceraceosorus guamensis]PWN38664.1 hypothetical protein IE81DRAFT_369670 [Ceraceosorus guamensis]
MLTIAPSSSRGVIRIVCRCPCAEQAGRPRSLSLVAHRRCRRSDDYAKTQEQRWSSMNAKRRVSTSAAKRGEEEEMQESSRTKAQQQGQLANSHRTRLYPTSRFKPSSSNSIPLFSASGQDEASFASSSTTSSNSVHWANVRRQDKERAAARREDSGGGKGGSKGASAHVEAGQTGEGAYATQELKILASDLHKHSNNRAWTMMFKTAEEMRRRAKALQQQGQQQIADGGGGGGDAVAVQSSAPKPPLQVFLHLMRQVPFHVALAVHDDMRSYYPASIRSLTMLLIAAINHQAGEREVRGVLDRFAQIGDREGAMQYEDERETAASSIRPLLSRWYTRHWTPGVYTILLTHSIHIANLELMLSILGALPAAFQRTVLTPKTQSSILFLICNHELPRLASELAKWFFAITGRKADDAGLFRVLRCSARHGWYPGVQWTYQRLVTEGRHGLEGGLVQQVMSTCARAGDVTVIETVINEHQHEGKLSLPAERHKLLETISENHLLWLFLAHSHAAIREQVDVGDDSLDQRNAPKATYDFHAAFATLARFNYLSYAGPKPVELLALIKLISTPEAWAQAHSAWIEQGRAQVREGDCGGSTTAGLFVLIESARRLRMYQEAWSVYHERRHVRRARGRFVGASALDAAAAAQDDATQTGSNTRTQLDESAQTSSSSKFYALPPAIPQEGAGQDWPPIHAEVEHVRSQMHVSADLACYHSLLDLCIDTRDADLGRSLLRDMSCQRPLIRGDEATYQRMISLVTTRIDDAAIDEALDWLEEAKARGLTPTPQSYRLVWKRCWRSGDDRANDVKKEWEEVHALQNVQELQQTREIHL